MFIVVEGADGVGKTTLISKLVKKLTHQGANVLQTREPYDDTNMGHGNTYQQIQAVLNDQSSITPLSRWRLFTTNQRIHFSEVLLDALESLNCDYIICDRFVPSTVVYYTELSVKDALDYELKHGLMHNQKTLMLLPDLYIYLQLDENKIRKRLAARKRSNPNIVDYQVDPVLINARYEKLFEDLWSPAWPPVLRLDASRSLHALTQACLDTLSPMG